MRLAQAGEVPALSTALAEGGLVFTAEDGRGDGLVGGCLVLPPERRQLPAAVDGRTALRWLRVMGTQLPRAINLKRAMQERHLSEPHYYVRTVGVRPALQGSGLGTALMRLALERCDSDYLPAYLAASSERSAVLYARLGFVDLDPLALPQGAAPLWPMRRPPTG